MNLNMIIIYIITIGNSYTFTKSIPIQNIDSTSIINIELIPSNYPDKFSFEFSNGYLIVKRIDLEQGWDYNHLIILYKQ